MKGRTSHVATVVPLFVLVVVWVLLAPSGDWSQPEFVVALGGIAVVSFFWETRLHGQANFLSATIALALVALAVAGPGAALAVWLVPDLVERALLRRRALITPGLVANVNGYGVGALAGAAVFALADPSTLGGEAATLMAAGLSMWVANFLLTQLLYGVAFERVSARELTRLEVTVVGPQMLAVLALGVVAALLIEPLGLFALALLAVAVVLPQAALASLTSARRVSRLERSVVIALYAAAIADVLKLSRRERRVLALAATLPAYAPARTLRGVSHELAARALELSASLNAGADVQEHEARLVADRAGDRYDGEDWPEGLSALAAQPLASRILAVARGWAGLTAARTAELPHSEAICLLAAKAGTELDPIVVEAAAQVVADEETFVHGRDAEPRLHRLPLPAPLRRGGLPALVSRFASS